MTSVTIGSSVTNIGNLAFEGCGNLASVTIPASVKSIGAWAFAYCSGLTNLTIPDSVTSIGNAAFLGCEWLADDDGLIIIRNVVHGFRYDAETTEIAIPDSVTAIGDYALAEYYGLAGVTIPDSVTSIGERAFYRCVDLANVTMRGDCPSVGSDAFEGGGASCVLHVSRGSTGWGVDIPGTWYGLDIRYLTPEVEIAMANDAGGGTVEVDAGEFSGAEVASGVTLMMKGEGLNAAALAEKITPKPHEDGQDVSFFKVKSEVVDGGVSLAVVLDEDAVEPDETASESVDDKNMAAFNSAAGGAMVSVSLPSAKPGLYYGIAVADDIAGLEAAAANVPLLRAGDGGISIPVAKPTGGAAFFKVVVSDRTR